MSILGSIKEKIFGPETVEICSITNPCEICDSACIGLMHLDSNKQPEMLEIKCPKCGPIKILYAGQPWRRFQPEPRFQRNYAEWLTGDYRKPTPKKEI